MRLKVSTRECESRGNIGIDLFLEDGTVLPLCAQSECVRVTLANTHCNVLKLDESEHTHYLALVVGWPRPLRPGRLIMHSVEADELLTLQVRVKLAELPPTVISGEHMIEFGNPWIQVHGPVKDASEPLCSGAPQAAEAKTVLAGDLTLRKGCTLASPPDQVVYRLIPASVTSTIF